MFKKEPVNSWRPQEEEEEEEDGEGGEWKKGNIFSGDGEGGKRSVCLCRGSTPVLSLDNLDDHLAGRLAFSRLSFSVGCGWFGSSVDATGWLRDVCCVSLVQTLWPFFFFFFVFVFASFTLPQTASTNAKTLASSSELRHPLDTQLALFFVCL